MKKYLLCLISGALLSCSPDSPENGVPEENPGPGENEVQTVIAAYSITVSGDYFESAFTGHMLVSDPTGKVLAEKQLVNNTENQLEIEVPLGTIVDFTYVTRDDRGFARNLTSHTFRNTSNGAYFLNARQGNGNGDAFTLAITNTGTSFESVNGSPENASYSSANGGSYQKDFELPEYPGEFYAVYKSNNDATPRYFYNAEVERNATLSVDFTTLPFVQDKITVEFPHLNIRSATLSGFSNGSDKRVKHLLDRMDNQASDDLVYAGEYFDNFELSGFMQCCNDIPLSYGFRIFGPAENRVFEFPAYSAELENSALADFSIVSMTAHDFNTVTYSNGIASIFDDLYSFHIHTRGNAEVAFSMETLVTHLLQDESVTAGQLEFRSIELRKNTALTGNYQAYIQDTLDEPEEYPSGTQIESCSFTRNSFP